MGYLKQNAILVNCDNVCEIETAIATNNLTVVLSYPLSNGSTNVLKGTLTFTKQSANSFTKTAAEYGAIFAEAIGKMGNAAGINAIPVVEEKVTSSGALVGAIAPSYAAAFAAP